MNNKIIEIRNSAHNLYRRITVVRRNTLFKQHAKSVQYNKYWIKFGNIFSNKKY